MMIDPCTRNRQWPFLRARFLAPFATLTGVLAAANPAGAIVVYNGSLNTLPASQGWVTYLPPLGTGGGTQTANAGGYVVMETIGANSNRGGYFSHLALPPFVPLGPVNGNWPTLNAATGYTIRLDLRMVAETHATNHRAGISVITINSAGMGIEVSFWMDRVWSQEGGTAPQLFTQAEGRAISAAQMRVYELVVHGSTYVLYADGAFVLTGPLRDYSAFDAGASGLPFNPYTTRNFLFVGDNTASASATAHLARIEALTTPVSHMLGCQPADIADDSGTPLPTNGSNGGVNEGDYNAFFLGFFEASAWCDIADDAGIAPPAGDNNGVNEGDYNAFFMLFFTGCG